MIWFNSGLFRLFTILTEIRNSEFLCKSIYNVTCSGLKVEYNYHKSYTPLPCSTSTFTGLCYICNDYTFRRIQFVSYEKSWQTERTVMSKIYHEIFWNTDLHAICIILLSIPLTIVKRDLPELRAHSWFKHHLLFTKENCKFYDSIWKRSPQYLDTCFDVSAHNSGPLILQ